MSTAAREYYILSAGVLYEITRATALDLLDDDRVWYQIRGNRITFIQRF